MKSLKESLFDKDLVTKDLDIEKLTKDFSSDTLQELSVEERNGLMDTLFEFGHRYNAAELRAHPIDLNKNILIIRRDILKASGADYPCKFVFVFNSTDKWEEESQVHRAALMNYRNYSNITQSRYAWDCNKFREWIKKPTWKGQVSAAYSFYDAPSFSVIEDENMVKNIIKGILVG